MIKKKQRKFIIYFHRNKKTKSIFYVGIGIQGRQYQRIKRSKRWNDYVNKYGFYFEIIGENLNWATVCKAEKEWIKFLGRADYYQGELINMTDGGDGTCGYHGYWLGKKRGPLTEDHKQKLRINSSTFWLNKKIPKEMRDKISQTLKKRNEQRKRDSDCSDRTQLLW